MNWSGKTDFLQTIIGPKKTQERFFKYSQNNLLMDYALLLSKFVTDKRAIISLSGEYGLENS